MSLKILFSLLAAAALGGALIGYVFRWLLVLARKGSIEVEVKKLLLDAREKAETIGLSADEAKTLLPPRYTGFVAATHASYAQIEKAGNAVGKIKPRT